MVDNSAGMGLATSAVRTVWGCGIAAGKLHALDDDQHLAFRDEACIPQFRCTWWGPCRSAERGGRGIALRQKSRWRRHGNGCDHIVVSYSVGIDNNAFLESVVGSPSLRHRRGAIDVCRLRDPVAALIDRRRTGRGKYETLFRDMAMVRGMHMP